MLFSSNEVNEEGWQIMEVKKIEIVDQELFGLLPSVKKKKKSAVAIARCAGDQGAMIVYTPEDDDHEFQLERLHSASFYLVEEEKIVDEPFKYLFRELKRRGETYSDQYYYTLLVVNSDRSECHYYYISKGKVTEHNHYQCPIKIVTLDVCLDIFEPNFKGTRYWLLTGLQTIRNTKTDDEHYTTRLGMMSTIPLINLLQERYINFVWIKHNYLNLFMKAL